MHHTCPKLRARGGGLFESEAHCLVGECSPLSPQPSDSSHAGQEHGVAPALEAIDIDIICLYSIIVIIEFLLSISFSIDHNYAT